MAKRQKFDIEFHNNGSFVEICPVTARGKRWAKQNIIGEKYNSTCYPADTRLAFDIYRAAQRNGKLRV